MYKVPIFLRLSPNFRYFQGFSLFILGDFQGHKQARYRSVLKVFKVHIMSGLSLLRNVCVIGYKIALLNFARSLRDRDRLEYWVLRLLRDRFHDHAAEVWNENKVAWAWIHAKSDVNRKIKIKCRESWNREKEVSWIVNWRSLGRASINPDGNIIMNHHY